MKKILSLMLVLLMTLSLCACSQVEGLQNLQLPPLPEVTEEPEVVPVATPETTETPEEPAETPEPADAPPETLSNRVIVNFKRTSLENYDPETGENLILSFSYDTPVVYIDGRDEAAEAINEYIARLDESYYTGNDYGDGYSSGYYGFLEQAEDNYTYVRESGTELPIEYSATRDARVERADQHALSILLTSYEYLGGAHGIYVDRAYVFDTVSGKRLSLDELSDDPEALRAFILQRMLEIREADEEIRAATDSFLGENEQPEDILAPLLREGSWYLNQEGLVIFSDLYEIAPYAAGIQSFLIPYEELAEYLNPAWLPFVPEGEGSVSALALEALEDGSVEIVDRLAVNEDGTEICLLVDGAIWDVQIQDAAYVADYGFMVNRLLWNCSYLWDCAVQVAAIIPDGIPNLMLSYRTGNGQLQRFLLSQSGEDGSFLLIGDDIEAVG